MLASLAKRLLPLSLLAISTRAQLDVSWPDQVQARHTSRNTSSSHGYVLDGHHLPKDFIFSCGTSAYQIEGATGEKAEGGKGQSIWDVFAHQKGLGHIANDDDGDVAVDFYHSYPEDLPLFRKTLGINQFDFTVAWTRILPNGTGTVANKDGIDFYRNVIKASHAAGMTAACTLYHWDLPQALQDKYGGWVDKQVVEDFRNYANVFMEELGNDCDDILSMNEPRTFCVEGYGPEPESAPNYPNATYDTQLACMHNAMLAHSVAHEVFQEKKKAGKVRGKFGIKIDGQPGVAMDPTSAADKEALKRHYAFEFWEVAPLVNGSYNEVMRNKLGDRLPKFTTEESKRMANSYDFIAFDAYTSAWVGGLEGEEDGGAGCGADSDFYPSCVNASNYNNEGYLIGKPTQSTWNFLANSSVYDGLKYMHQNGVKAFTVGENGMAIRNDSQLLLGARVADADRVDWYRSTFKNIKWVLDEKMPLIGFSAWSCINNLEWSGGYKIKFGLIDANPGSNQPRTPKSSAHYVRQVMTGQIHSQPPYFAEAGI